MTKVYIRKKGKKIVSVGETSGWAVESTNGDHPLLTSGKHPEMKQATDKPGKHEEAVFRPSNEGSTEVLAVEVAAQEKRDEYRRNDEKGSEKEKGGREKIVMKQGKEETSLSNAGARIHQWLFQLSQVYVYVMSC